MALLINKNIDFKGVPLTSLYVRLEYKVAMDSSSIKINARPFVSKDIYKNQGYYSHLNIPEFSPYMTFVVDYDRNEDGDYVLQVVHNKTKDLLSTDITEERALFYEEDGTQDPSTGEWDYLAGDPILDPSTGEQMTETVVVRDKFATDSSISIIDVSLG